MSELMRKRVGFFAGVLFPVRGMRVVFVTHRALVRYWITPVLVINAAMVALAVFVVQHRSTLADLVWTLSPTDAQQWGWLALHAVLAWLLAAIVFAASTMALLMTSQVIAAPFNDALSAAVERLYGAPVSSSSLSALLADVLRSIRIEATKLLAYLAVMTPLLLLSLALPAIGGPALSIVGFMITLAYIAFDYTDWPAARRGVGLRQRLRWAAEHAAALAGFGLATWLLLLVPVLNLFLMPAAVVGGTLLYLELERSAA